MLLAVALGSVAFFVTGALYSPAAAIAVTAGLTGLAANYLVRGAPPTALTKTMKPR